MRPEAGQGRFTSIFSSALDLVVPQRRDGAQPSGLAASRLGAVSSPQIDPHDDEARLVRDFQAPAFPV